MAVNLKYFQDCPNVGDQFSRVIAEHYFSPDINPVPCDYGSSLGPNLLLVGSILGCADTMSCVCGAGFIGAGDRLRQTPRYISGVRGPLTASILERQGLRSRYVFGDPGLFASKFFPRSESANTEIGIIPHYIDMNSPWVQSCRDQGLTIIDVLAPLDEFFKNLQQCAIILSSSLHGLIFAHSYEIPAVWIELSDQVVGRGFKFFDYYLSVGVSHEDVTRFQVMDDSDPHEIAKLATVVEYAKLLSPLETAIYNTKVELEKATKKNKLS